VIPHGVRSKSPLSPFLCNIFMEELEEKAILSYKTKPLVCERYVDDVIFVWPGSDDSIHDFHKHLNS
jgi:retron-type reverse transcriptase